LFLFGLLVIAQEAAEPITIGHKYTLKSEILGQDRPVLVFLPDSYEKDSTANYPVLYLLDGGGNFHHTTATVNFLAHSGRIPEMIVVGIPNTDDRTRDLTPSSKTDKDRFPSSGGADTLLNFIQKELFTYVAEHFRVENYKMLVGHSFGGLFAIHTLIHHPGIFDSYLAISPSLWWDDQDLVLEQSKSFFESQKDLAGHLYMTMGGEDGTMLGGAWKLAALLEEKGSSDLHWFFDRMPEETHGSIPQKSTIKGLEYIFGDWQWNKLEEQMEERGVAALKSYEDKLAKLYGLPLPLRASNLNRLGDKLIDSDRASLAAPIFKRATELFVDSDRSWFGYGHSLQKIGKKEAAISALKKAQQLNPEGLQSLVLLKRMGEDVSEFLPDITLSVKELSMYAADYTLDVGATLKIAVEGGRLYAESPPVLMKEELTPLGEDRFFIASKNASIIFSREDSKVMALTVDTPDGKFEGKRK